jgi:metalloprotein, YbeY family
MNILLSHEVDGLPIDEDLAAEIRRAVEKVGELYDAADAEVSITLTDDAHIHALNREYRAVDRPTDVISFALNESEEPEIAGGPAIDVLGDIVLSVERAKAQAAEYGHSLRREIVFLTVHGMLHLLGYDHVEEAERQEMEEEQRHVMAALGVLREEEDDAEKGTEKGESDGKGKA